MFIAFRVYFIAFLVIKIILYGHMIMPLMKYDLIKALSLKGAIKNSDQDNKCPN
jgi:hypothetical protein